MQKFQIIVKKPLRITLTPSKISICETQEAVFELKLSGGWPATSIQWSYTFYSSETPLLIQRATRFIKISPNKVKVTVTHTAWIYVTVVWKYGTLKTQANVNVVGM